MFNGIDYINNLSDNEYDKMLTENIVFINLVDASAINTVIECIVRNTPIIVNNHPAVIELLGPKYPLYFNTNYKSYFDMNKEVYDLLLTPNNISKAYKYLNNIDKSKFSIKNFTNNFVDYLKNLT